MEGDVSQHQAPGGQHLSIQVLQPRCFQVAGPFQQGVERLESRLDTLRLHCCKDGKCSLHSNKTDLLTALDTILSFVLSAHTVQNSDAYQT